MFSLLIGIGSVAAVFLQRSAWVGSDRYVDSVLVLVGCLVLAPQPLALLRKAGTELLESAPDARVQAPVIAAFDRVRKQFGLDTPTLAMSKVGRNLYVEAVFVVAPGQWDVSGEDRVRRAVRDQLAGLPHDLWITVELTTDPQLA
ncbi:hypothetical protein [Nocardia sp. 348MFTsu5.1]|uniref:hypothetical protein n=1 Tax=Nocardia sp. 348MFTsu5.1 TaxID=1172185 RepID=UPI00037A4B3C|nr:hypothetical protein [Nocardia sp. 348MFTsu5.1]